MEERDLYNIKREVTGDTIYKGEEIPVGKYILIVVAIIENLEGKFLIQKRSSDKGGKWALTGGHPKKGETSLEGIYTEVKEELGIDIVKPLLFKQATGEDTICDMYYIKQDIKLESVNLQKEEVDDIMYASIDEINKLYDEGMFKIGHYKMFKDYLKTK